MEIDFERNGRKLRRITLIPMINVIFLLLAFFLVSNASFAGNKDVALPSIGSASAGDSDGVTLRLDADGKLFVDGTETAQSLLENNVADKIRKSDSHKVQIEADSRLDANKMINLMQGIQKAVPSADVSIIVQKANSR